MAETNDTIEEFIVEALCETLKCDEFDIESGQDSYYFDTGGGNGSLSVTNQRLEQLKNELNGLTLNITYMDDYPLSYTVLENGKVSAKGVAFELLEFLTEKLNFSYTLVKPEKNIMGSSDQYNGSILELLDTEVIIEQNAHDSREQICKFILNILTNFHLES